MKLFIKVENPLQADGYESVFGILCADTWIKVAINNGEVVLKSNEI